MSTSDLRTTLLSGLVALAGLTGLTGCADSADSAGADGDMFTEYDFGTGDVGPGGDVGPDVEPGCGFAVGGRCLDDPDDRCAWAAGLGPDCSDLDGDCFPDCVVGDGAPIDCDDTRADVNPAAVELCTGYDDDCDGRVDEDYPTLGAECFACEQPGKFECAVDALDGVACSALPGQSEPAVFEPETCNGVDDDCDGAVDERCAIDAGLALAMPALCPDGRIALVRDGALAIATPSGTGAYDVEVVPRDAPVAHPHCGPAGIAWLELGEAGCSTPVGGPTRCAAEIWAAFGDAPPLLIASYGSLGPPVVGVDAVYWHSIAGDMPSLVKHTLGGETAQLLDGAVSDPTPPVDGWMLAREWFPPIDGGVATAKAALIEVEVDEGEIGRRATLSSPGSGAGGVGAVARSADWLAWLIGDASPDIWVLRADTPRSGGFFPLSTPGERSRPHVVGERLVWLDPTDTPPTLRAFDLGTGVEQVLATGQIELDGFAVGADAVVWVDEADGTLRRRGLAPIGQ